MANTKIARTNITCSQCQQEYRIRSSLAVAGWRCSKPRCNPPLRVHYYGTLAVLLPQTKRALSWMKRNLQTDPWQWAAGGLVTEPKTAEEIAEAAQQALA